MTGPSSSGWLNRPDPGQRIEPQVLPLKEPVFKRKKLKSFVPSRTSPVSADRQNLSRMDFCRQISPSLGIGKTPFVVEFFCIQPDHSSCRQCFYESFVEYPIASHHTGTVTHSILRNFTPPDTVCVLPAWGPQRETAGLPWTTDRFRDPARRVA